MHWINKKVELAKLAITIQAIKVWIISNKLRRIFNKKLYKSKNQVKAHLLIYLMFKIKLKNKRFMKSINRLRKIINKNSVSYY